jgi:hypothetical protein
MKKTHLRSFIINLILISLIACSSPKEGNSNTASGGKTENKTVAENNTDKIGLFGEVSEIIGNEVSLKVIKKPEKQAGNQEENENGGGRGGGGRGGDGASSGGVREREYTGEVETVVIPVGVSIVTVTRGENGMEENEVSMNEITPSSILSIYYGDDGKIIEKVKVQKPRTGGGQGGKGSN